MKRKGGDRDDHRDQWRRSDRDSEADVGARRTRARRSRRSHLGSTDEMADVHGRAFDAAMRLTALAARHRGDLVFPFGEERDEAGRVTRVSGLAAYRRTWAPQQSWRDWRVSARAMLIGRPLGRAWPTAVLFTIATAFLSGFLALIPGVAGSAVDHGWAAGGQAVASWSSAGFLLAGAAALATGAQRWRKRAVILGERGTAYVIDEIAMPWQHEEKESFLTSVRANFAPSPWLCPARAGLATHGTGRRTLGRQPDGTSRSIRWSARSGRCITTTTR